MFCNPVDYSHQAPLSMRFPSQEYWSGLPFPPPGDLPDPGIEPASPALAGGIFTIREALGLFASFTTANHLSLLGGATINAVSHPLLNLPVSPTQFFCLGELLSDSVVWQEQTQHSHLSSVWGSLSCTSRWLWLKQREPWSYAFIVRVLCPQQLSHSLISSQDSTLMILSQEKVVRAPSWFLLPPRSSEPIQVTKSSEFPGSPGVSASLLGARVQSLVRDLRFPASIPLPQKGIKFITVLHLSNSRTQTKASVVVQWLRFPASNAGDMGLIP